MVGRGTGFTVSVTFTTCGVFVAPAADTVIAFVYVPTAKLALLTDAVNVPFPVPPPGDTDNHAGALPFATAVQLNVPPPLFDTATT